jgi:hypothetical protein
VLASPTCPGLVAPRLWFNNGALRQRQPEAGSTESSTEEGSFHLDGQVLNSKIMFLKLAHLARPLSVMLRIQS